MKYFISDLDGTLLQDKNDIHPLDILAIHSLSDMQICFGIATGRDLGFCSSLMKKAKIHPDVMILNNGGSLFVNDEKVMELELRADEIEQIMHFLSPYIGALHPFVCDEERTFYMMKNKYDLGAWGTIKEELSYLGNICEEDLLEHLHKLSSPIIKLSIYVQDDTQTNRWSQLLQQQFSHAYEVLMTASDYIEFTKKGVHKGTALQALERHFHMDARDVIFIGDGENDIMMMDVAGYSFAMHSASDEVKQHADEVVSSVCDAIAILHSRYDNGNDQNDNKKFHIQSLHDIG